MSGEEHKKGRVSELEGQQRASGRAMFLLSGPLREGAKEGGNARGAEGGTVLSLPGKSRGAEYVGHPSPQALFLTHFY